MRFLTRQFILILLIASLVVPAGILIKPRPADAIVSCLLSGIFGGLSNLGGLTGAVSVPVYDAANASINSRTAGATTNVEMKECVIDFLVSVLAETLIQNFTRSIIDWINSGFQGSPAFVTNPEGFFVDVSDQVIGNFIETELGSLGELLCSPFDLQLRISLGILYSSSDRDRISCRLTDIQRNVYDAFTAGSFVLSGGWDSWYAFTALPQNNVWGSYLLVSDSLNSRLSQKINTELEKLRWGRGFLSYQKCVEKNADGTCKKKGPIQTPGSVIERQLNDTLGLQSQKIAVADEINEILGALINQALVQVFRPGGLLGISSARPELDEPRYLDRLGSGDVLTDYGTNLERAGGDTTYEGALERAGGIPEGLGSTTIAVGTQRESEVREQNLAFNKPARQSGDWRNNTTGTLHEARNAVDGSSSGFYTAAVSYDPSGQQKPWWEVNLGTVERVGRVEIYQDPAYSFIGCLIIGREPLGDAPLTCRVSPTDTVTKISIPWVAAPRPMVLTVQTEGRFIRVQTESAADNLLVLPEVLVFRPSEAGQIAAAGGESTFTIEGIQSKNRFFPGDTYSGNLTLSTNTTMGNLAVTITLKKVGADAVPFSSVFNRFEVVSQDFIKTGGGSLGVRLYTNAVSLSPVELRHNAAVTVGLVGTVKGGYEDGPRFQSANQPPVFGNYNLVTELKDREGTVRARQVFNFHVARHGE